MGDAGQLGRGPKKPFARVPGTVPRTPIQSCALHRVGQGDRGGANKRPPHRMRADAWIAATALLYGLPQRQRRPADSSGRQRHVPQPVFWERVHRTIPLAEHGEMQCTATIKAAAILGAGAAFLTHPDAGVPSGARTLAQGSPERLYGRPRRHLLRRPCRQWQDLPPHAVAGLATGALGSEDAVAFLVPYLSIRTQVADTRRLARSYRGKCQRLAFPVNLPILATSCLMRDPAYGRRRIPSEWLSATLISLARVNGNVRAP